MIVLTDKTKKLIIDFEGLNQPSKWPGGDSGITLGIGYDLGYVTVDQFESDWALYLTADQLKRLRGAVGKRRIAAKNRAVQLQDIKIKRKEAETVFIERNLPLYALKTEMTFPGIAELPRMPRARSYLWCSIAALRWKEIAEPKCEPYGMRYQAAICRKLQIS